MFQATFNDDNIQIALVSENLALVNMYQKDLDEGVKYFERASK